MPRGSFREEELDLLSHSGKGTLGISGIFSMVLDISFLLWSKVDHSMNLPHSATREGIRVIHFFMTCLALRFLPDILFHVTCFAFDLTMYFIQFESRPGMIETRGVPRPVT